MSDLVIEPSAALSSSALGDAEMFRRRLLRLAFDVHDGPMQSLTAIGYGLHDLQRMLGQHRGPVEHGAAIAQIDLLTAELGSAETALRALLTTLERGAATELDTLDVIAVSELERFARRCDVVTEMVVDSDVRPDSHSQALAIGAVLREALNNVAKHANASEVLVRLQADDTRIVLEVRDDGDGFDLAAVEGDSIGMTSMRERVGLLGGDLEIASKPGGPTLVTASLRRWRSED